MAKRNRMAYAAAALVPLALLAAACTNTSSASNAGSSSSPSTSTKLAGGALPAKPASAHVSLTETGSTLLFPLMGAWASAYHKSYSQVSITTAGTGSGTGITDASTGTVNIGASDAYLSSAEKAKTPSLLSIALAISAQETSFNVPGIKSLKLDGTVLAGIYSGKITMWNAAQIKALNPGVSLPALKIVPLRRLDSSGDTFLFTSYLNAQDPSGWSASNVGTTVSWPAVPGELSETGNGGMVSGCAATKGCIAYIGISYLAKTQAAGLGQALLKNAAGSYVAPTSANIAAAASAQTSKTPASETLSLINGPGATSYPVINYEYAVVNTKQTNATTAEDIRAFLHWAVTTGQNVKTYLSAVNFQPLAASIVTLSDNQIAKIGS